MTKEMYSNERYEVLLTDEASVLREDGERAKCLGYIVRNKETGVQEGSTVCLPNAMYMADHFNEMLKGFEEQEKEDKPQLELIDFGGDVVPN